MAGTRATFAVLVFAAHMHASAQDSTRCLPDIQVRHDLMIPMRDGVRLAADLYLPAGARGRLPVIVERSPYDKSTKRGGTAEARWIAEHGYAVVLQDVRGQGASEGAYAIDVADAIDGYDTIEWVARQPWSNGRVGTFGCSYAGDVQYLLAKMRPPHLRAMWPSAGGGAVGPAGGFYANWGAYEGGALTLSTTFGWFTHSASKVRPPNYPNLDSINFGGILRSLPLVDMARKAALPPNDWVDFVTHPPADRYWDGMHYLRDDDRFDVPAFHESSWFDPLPEQALYAFNLMRRNAASSLAAKNQFVVIWPTVHCAYPNREPRTIVGERDVGDARYPINDIIFDWFAHWLKGVDNGVTKRPKVLYYVTGLGEWRTSNVWPVPGMKLVPYYLSSTAGARTGAGDGVLDRTRPPHAGEDRFSYDPADPFPSRGGTICCTGNPKDEPGMFDQKDLEARSDVLVYSTPILRTGITITGPVRAVLYVSSDAHDTDFTAKLIDVDEQGHAWNVANGILRARYRDGMGKTVWMRADGVYRLEISLKSTAYHFAPGHRIRLYISSSDFPAYDRNLNTGGDNVTETTWTKAMNVVHHGGSVASHLLLPVAP
jgi:hypothetical protein